MIKKYAIFIIFMLIFQFGKSQLYYKSATFNVINATKKTFFPGVMGSPITTTFTFDMVIKRCTRLQFDSFWADGFSDQVHIAYASGAAWDGKVMKGDTLKVTLNYYRLTSQTGIPREELGLTGSPETAAPLDHKGQVLFRYSFGDKKYYFSVQDVKVAESVYAP